MIQYWAALVITRANKGRSRDHLYQEIGLESLVDKPLLLYNEKITLKYDYCASS